ncbi:MAG TPA: hypothetical protein VK363_01900 [Pyrinomonadaceae bacterium]|nr:hypothetical protein [Pyrinomonadaceae bacterium]
MALIDQVKAACQRLASHGWSDLLLAHGLDITKANLAHELARTLPGIKRSVKGFEDFALEGRKGVTPGQPAQSLLYHAFASANVLMRADGSRLTAFPTLAEIEAVENYVFSVDAPSLQQLKNRAGRGARLAVVVFAYEYRPASQTCHKKHADLVFSRTGVARVGTAIAHYDASRRGFVSTEEREQFAVRVSPARYAAYIAVATRGDESNFCPLRFRIKGATPNDPQKSDAERMFWQPLHKLFSGRECLRGFRGALDVSLNSIHLNEKLRRIHLILSAQHGSPGVPFDTGWTEPDISQSPFRFTRGIAEFSTKAEYGQGVLIPVAHQRLVEPASYKGKPLTFNVPAGSNMLSSSIEIPWDAGALRAPEYVHARHRVRDNGTIENLNDVADVTARVKAGNYKALHYLDFTGDGAIEARCPQLVGQASLAGFIPAYSLVTAPDFFPTCDQRELTEWTDTLKPEFLKEVWRVKPDTLSDQRYAGNLQLPNSPFSKTDNTLTAIVPMYGKNTAQQTLTKEADTLRHSHMPDNSAGVFAPGWDVSRDRAPDGTWHLSAYGLGSPFPEDAKLCAALSTFWPAAAPDATRTFTYGPLSKSYFTVSPLTDEEIGQVGDLPWDGTAGPKVVTSGGQEFAEYASFDHVDYVENSLQSKFSLRVTAHVDLEEYQRRVLAMALAYKVLGLNKMDWIVLSFRRVNPGTPELVAAQAEAQLTLPGTVYRFEVFKNPKLQTIPGNQFLKRRMEIKGRETLLVDADNRRALSKASTAGATWKGKEVANI